MKNNLKAGEFTGLASFYSENRPDYCRTVLNSLLGMFEQNRSDISVVDIGAGTGIWTRMLYETGIASIIAVEPNKDMREKGEADSINKKIEWLDGSAEKTGIKDNSIDWVTMASSFHWANFEKATREFNRILKKNGRFTALWNPRLIEVNPLLVDIEKFLALLKLRI